jgi:hypothetical protein
MLDQRWYTLLLGAAVTAVLVLGLVYLAGAARTRRQRVRRGVRSLLAGADNRLSTSKTIVALWTVVVAWMLVSETILATAQDRPLGDLAVGADYLLLLGGPFASAVLAKGIVVTRLSNGTIQKTSAPDDAKLRTADLVSDDAGRTDLVDFQYALFNLIAVGIVVVLFAAHPARGMPDVPSGLLAVTSAAAAAYVGNKAVGARTPRISRIDPGVARPGQAVTLVGSNLVAPGGGATTATVTVNGIGAAVLSSDPGAVTARIPPDATVSEPGKPAVVELVSDDAGLTRAEATVVLTSDAVTLSQVAPATPAPGVTVMLTGRGFLSAGALGGGDGVLVDPPVVRLAAAGNGSTGGELARVSPAGSTDTTLTFIMPALAVAPATPLTATVVRGLLSSGPVPLVLGALPRQPGQLPMAGPRSVDAAEGYDYGDGVATISGARRATRAVHCTRPATSQATGWSQEIRVSLCETVQEVYDALDISVDTTASYGPASVSEKFGLAQSSQQTGFSLHLVVLATVRSPLALVGDVSLTDEAKELLTDRRFEQFYVRFGDKFVSGLVVGGEYSAVLSLETSSDDDKQTLKNSLGIAVQLGKLDASVQSEVTKTLNQFTGRLSMRLFQKSRGGSPAVAAPAGGLPTVPADGAAPAAPQLREANDIFTAAIGFPGTVTKRTAQPVVAQLSNYSELALPDSPAFVRFLTDSGGLYSANGPLKKLDDLATARASLIADLARVRALLRNPFGYVDAPQRLLERFGPVAEGLSEQIATLDRTVAGYLQAVQADPTNAPQVEVPRHPPVALPRRNPDTAYLITSFVGDRLAVSAPPDDPANGPEGPLVLARADATDLRQVWLAPDLGTGEFRMRNAFTGLYVAHAGDSIQLSQTSNPAEATLWTMSVVGGGFGFFPAGDPGLAVNAEGNGGWDLGTPVVLYHTRYAQLLFGTLDANFLWHVDPVPVQPPAPSAVQSAVPVAG